MTIKEVAFVSTTSVSAELFDVGIIAKEMSISVKNAKAISHRAGEKARGFSPITDFIDEMSIETMKLVDLINKNAIELSRIAIEELITRDALAKFEAASALASNAKHQSSLTTPCEELKQKLHKDHAKLHDFSRKIKDLMDDISQKMALANVIVSNSRIEAVNADEYRSNLESIADDIETACSTIRDRVNGSKQRLENAIQQWKGNRPYESN